MAEITATQQPIEVTADITWSVLALDCATSKDGKEHVVLTVHWSASGKEQGATTGTVYESYTYGAQSVEYDSTGTFIAYDNLTPDVVLAWVKPDNEERVGQILQAQINEQKNPPIVKPVLPWAPKPMV
jgi:hypothetical protein